MKLTTAVLAIFAAMALLGGGLAMMHSMGGVMTTAEMAGLGLGLCVVGGSVIFGLRASAISVRAQGERTARFAARFSAIATRTGLRMQQLAPMDHPIVGKVAALPTLSGLYRGWRVGVQFLFADEGTDGIELVVSAGRGVKWPKLGRVSGSGSPGMSPSACAAVARLNARRRGPDRVRSVHVSETTLRAVTTEKATGSLEAELIGRSLLEGVLDDLMVVADGLPLAGVDVAGSPASSGSPLLRPLATRVVVLGDNGAVGPDALQRLASRGSSVQVLAIDDAALGSLAAKRPALILVSADPPAACSICNRLKRTATLHDVATILISMGPAEELFREHGKLATRADGYVEGPIDTPELLAHIEKLVRLGPPV
jgi:CheY-like chemotaxis protein